MNTLVRMIIYVLVLAAIGWSVSSIYVDPKFRTATAPAVETTLALTEASPPTPLAKPALDGDDAATAPAVETTPAPTEAAPPATFADAGDYVERRNGETIVDVPTTHVETGGDKNTRVRVRAPYTKVDVDTNRRRVRIRVPYYNGDIRW